MKTTARFALLGLALPALLGAAPGLGLVVKGSGTALGETPIVVELKPPVEPGPVHLSPVAKGGGELATIPASIYRDGSKTYLSAVLDRIPGGGQVEYRIVPLTQGDRAEPGIELGSEGGDVHVTLGGQPFTTYVAKTGPKPFYFPLIGPTGKPFTRAYPMGDVPGEKRDHPHHRSMWFTYGKLNNIDFWAETKGHGTIVETSRKVIQGSPAVGIIRTTDDWLAPDGKRVCTDERTVTFHDARKSRILDFDITIRATDGPVTFGDTKEGMFGLRVASSMDVDAKKGGKITNAEGLHDAAAWGKPSAWVDYVGPVAGETVGIAILNHPDSFRFPTTWHVRTYGLFAANPFGWHDFGLKKSGESTIPAGESIRFAYRVILHRGDTASADLPAAFSAYGKPPTVEVIP